MPSITKSQQTRGKKEKKPKKPTKTKLNAKADKEWSAKVKELAGMKCEVCGTTQHLNSHHIFSRVNHSVRWDLDNGICLCPSHHNFNHELSAHKAPCEFTHWIIESRGQDWYDRLRLKAKSVSKE